METYTFICHLSELTLEEASLKRTTLEKYVLRVLMKKGPTDKQQTDAQMNKRNNRGKGMRRWKGSICPQPRHPSLPLNDNGEDDISHARLALQRCDRGPPPAQQHMSESLTCVTSVCIKKWLTHKEMTAEFRNGSGRHGLYYTVKHHHLVEMRRNCSSEAENRVLFQGFPTIWFYYKKSLFMLPMEL